MRTSSYNILARVDEQEGLYAILNAYTQAFDIINTEVYNYLRVNGENGEITEETRDTLVKRGYLTSLSQKDEQELVKQLLDRAYDETRFKKNSFHFILSYNCNLRCVYCYEDPVLNGGMCLPKKQITKEQVDKAFEIIKEKAEEKLENESKPETDSTPDLDDRHEVEDVVEQMQDDLLEAEEMISDEPQAKDEPTVGEIWEAEQKITWRVKTKQEEKEKTIALPFGQPFCPFQDSDLNQCWKITPQDLAYFPRRQCALRNNRFLQYGYYNFGHLLLCHRSNGRYILGVPGSYDQQEQFMAGMFGFSCFKESNCIKAKKGRGGYWYRAIDPPAGC